MITIFKDQVAPTVRDTIKIQGDPYNLTGCTVKFKMRPTDGTTPKVDAAAVVDSPVNGQVSYAWIVGDTDTEGEYLAWWEVTLLNGNTQDTPEFAVTVIEHAPTTLEQLCTLEDMYTVMRITTNSDARDEMMEKFILQATGQIQNYCNRKFTPLEVGATKRFLVNVTGKRIRVDLTPYDLQPSPEPTLVLHPEQQAITLDPTNYEFRPFVTDDQTHTSVLLSPWQTMISTHQMKFGRPFIDITGTWGWTVVPEEVKRACEITVMSWMRRDVSALGGAAGQALGQSTGEGAPNAQATFYLPYAAQKLLDPFQRNAGAF